VFVIATTLVALLKHENVSTVAADPLDDEESGQEKELELGIFETYSMLWKIVCLPLMPVTIFVLLTHKVQS